jgi:hypothetical protein
VTLPGPPGAVWALELLVWAAGAALIGELLRGVAVRWVRLWRDLEPVERGLLDLYLGGAVVFLLAALPVAGFVLPVLVGLPVVAAGLVVARELRTRRARARTQSGRWPVAPAALVALATAFALLIYELAIALPVGTGNTYDASVLTTFVALLLRTHTIPLGLSPYSTVGVLYPQGTTVWVGWAQALFGLPPARASLLVTPLFFALAPLAAYAFGRRAFGSDLAGAGCAVFLAAVGTWTRVLVGGSYDFVIAFPLVLLLAGQAVSVVRGPILRWPDTIAFGILVGYSAALNPVGAQWLVPTMLVVGGVTWVRGFRDAGRWLLRWAGMVASALVALVPTLYVIALGWSNPALTPGAGTPPQGARLGIDTAQFIGGIDPYLFRVTDVWLSPVPALRDELAVLLTVGLVLLVLAVRWGWVRHMVGALPRFLMAGGATMVVLMALVWSASAGGAATRIANLTSAAELSIWLFTFYTLVAAVPLILVLERARSDRFGGHPESGRPSSSSPRSRWGGARGAERGPLALALALVIVVPGVVLSGTSLPPALNELYTRVGNVTADDLAMLEFAGAHLPTGARVLVAPGSAAEFLPGYAPNVVMLYPMVPGWNWINASYTLVVRELTNGTLDAEGENAMAVLGVEYILVTGANTVLWPPFSPAPLLASPTTFPLEYHAGDAYLFGRDATMS